MKWLMSDHVWMDVCGSSKRRWLECCVCGKATALSFCVFLSRSLWNVCVCGCVCVGTRLCVCLCLYLCFCVCLRGNLGQGTKIGSVLCAVVGVAPLVLRVSGLFLVLSGILSTFISKPCSSCSFHQGVVASQDPPRHKKAPPSEKTY